MPQSRISEYSAVGSIAIAVIGELRLPPPSPKQIQNTSKLRKCMETYGGKIENILKTERKQLAAVVILYKDRDLAHPSGTPGQYESLAGSEIPEDIRIWIDRFDTDPVCGHVRFKVKRMLMLPAQSKFPARLVDLVSAKEFALDEPTRLPLFCGTQVGIRPDPSSVLPLGKVRAVGIFWFLGTFRRRCRAFDSLD